ncbi:Rieske 2Fe-2S domain-containing protein [Streptomyces sp. NPDC059909]|uniref:Rieske 2Fe-2S domain-containing protein n=1 Tax=Streptomyces sp. NPDC059909 TaxID=3346998 RepID=UPI003652BD41
MLDEFCSHRTASLFFGRNEECGLRCSYQGWKYDVDGTASACPPSRRARRSRTASRNGRSRAASGAGSSGRTWGRPSTSPSCHGRARRRPPVRLQALAGVQLPAGHGGRHRLQPCLLRAPVQHR